MSQSLNPSQLIAESNQYRMSFGYYHNISIVLLTLTRRRSDERIAQQVQCIERDLQRLETDALQGLGVADKFEQLFQQPASIGCER
jgi:hypothetical protein